MKYVNGQTTTKPKFLPNGANFSMRHTYYNEWLVNKVPSGYGGDHGHADPVNEAVKTYAAGGNTKCLKCHSGLGFLNRIDAKAPTGTRIVPTFPTMSIVATADPGISCQVCHTGHVGMGEHGGYDSMRRWGNGKEVSCGDCHNWQFEMLDQAVQYETIGGVEYSRPAANTKSRHPQREMVTGGHGGEDGLGGLWGVAPMGTAMPDTTCKDCHMPRTHKEGMPANDDGTRVGTRMSHRFHVVEPGDAAALEAASRTATRAPSDCHKEEAAEYSRADMQAWIDQKQAAVASASARGDERAQRRGDRSGSDRLEQLHRRAAGRRRRRRAACRALGDAAARRAERRLRGQRRLGRHPQPGLRARRSREGAPVGRIRERHARRHARRRPGARRGHDGHGLAARLRRRRRSRAPRSCSRRAPTASTWSPVASAKPNASGAFSLPTGRIVGSRTLPRALQLRRPASTTSRRSCRSRSPSRPRRVVPAGADERLARHPERAGHHDGDAGLADLLHAHRRDRAAADALHRHDQRSPPRAGPPSTSGRPTATASRRRRRCRS